MKKPEVYVKRMLALEKEVVRESRKFCLLNDIPFYKAHETVIINAMREAVNNGAIPIFQEYIKEQKRILEETD